jgi:hypothetical protein
MRILLALLAFIGMSLGAQAQIRIGIINNSRIPDGYMERVIDAINVQLERDFFPIWHIQASVGLNDSNAWPILVTDNPTSVGTPGVHYAYEGVPVGEVGVIGHDWTTVLSHEVLEMVVNPYSNRQVIIARAGDTVAELWDLEVADACEDFAYSYEIDGIAVSDFVYPSYFMPGGRAPYDFSDHILYPFQILRNCHQIRYTVTLTEVRDR